MKVLFLSDCNGHEGANPFATLVETEATDEKQLRSLELKQLGVNRRGGSWKEIMTDGGIQHTILKEGRLSDFKDEDYTLRYDLISGNY